MKSQSPLARTNCPPTIVRRLRSGWATQPLALLLLALPAVAPAEDYTYTTNNGTITITGYTGLDGAVILPSSLSGLPVTRIGNGAFNQRTGLSSVTIGNGVTSIGDFAFSGCYSLTNVMIGNDLASIGDYAFQLCTSLASVTLPSSVNSIGEGAFNWCTQLTEIAVDPLNPVTSLWPETVVF